MKRSTAALLLATAFAAHAQSQPAGACPFAGFEDLTKQNPQIAEVATAGPAHTWVECGSPKGCLSLRASSGSPVLIYNKQGPWTCGYSADKHGAGPAWFRSAELRPVSYNLHPNLAAWTGIWAGGEDRVRIALAKGGKALHLTGNAAWHGNAGVEHFGDVDGDAAPRGNHLHFVEDGANSCTMDLTLLGQFILASDNQLCGGLNARFQGFWRRAAPAH